MDSQAGQALVTQVTRVHLRCLSPFASQSVEVTSAGRPPRPVPSSEIKRDGDKSPTGLRDLTQPATGVVVVVVVVVVAAPKTKEATMGEEIPATTVIPLEKCNKINNWKLKNAKNNNPTCLQSLAESCHRVLRLG